MLPPPQQRRLGALAVAMSPAAGRPSEDPRLAHARTLVQPDDPQKTRADIVLPSGKTRSDVHVPHGWKLSLELDYNREITRGSEAELTTAIGSGADLRVATNFPHNEHIDPTQQMVGDLVGEVATFPVTYLLRPAGGPPWAAGVMTTRQPIECPDGFGPRPSLSLFLYNQDGHQAIARPHLDGKPATGEGDPHPDEAATDDGDIIRVDGGPSYRADGTMFDPVASGRSVYLDSFDGQTSSPSHNFIWNFDFMKFFTGGYWQEVYSHDAEGAAISGSLETLAAAAGQGCDVKVAVSGICTDLVPDGGEVIDHELMVAVHSNYYYDGAQTSDLPPRLPAGACFTAATNPICRVAPAIPLQYSSGNWDYGWLYCRTDGNVAFRRLDPSTLQFDDRQLTCPMRWFVR